MPAWAAAVVAISAAAAGGLFGTLATIRHERRAEFRGRMLEAAAEFVRVAEAAHRHTLWTDAADNLDVSRAFHPEWQRTVTTVTIIELLYGQNSDTAASARRVGISLHTAGRSLGFLTPDDSERPDLDEALADYVPAMYDFGRYAAQEVRQGWLRATVASIRRRRDDDEAVD